MGVLCGKNMQRHHHHTVMMLCWMQGCDLPARIHESHSVPNQRQCVAADRTVHKNRISLNNNQMDSDNTVTTVLVGIGQPIGSRVGPE